MLVVGSTQGKWRISSAFKIDSDLGQDEFRRGHLRSGNSAIPVRIHYERATWHCDSACGGCGSTKIRTICRHLRHGGFGNMEAAGRVASVLIYLYYLISDTAFASLIQFSPFIP